VRARLQPTVDGSFRTRDLSDFSGKELLLAFDEFEAEMKQVLGFVFAAVPAIALLEFNAYVISDRLALAVYDLADKLPPGIFQVDDGADLNAAIHLDARARGGNIVQGSKLIVDLSPAVHPVDVQQISALITNVVPFIFHRGIIGKFHTIR